MFGRRVRSPLRYAHLAAGVAVAVVLYSPLVDNDAVLWVTRLALVPIMVLTGLWLWAQSRAWTTRAGTPEP